MIDINKGISDLEESVGRRLTDEEKSNIALLGEFMNTFWGNTKPNDSSPKPESLPKEEIRPMDIGEVIDGLDYCLSTGKCIGCANREGRMVASCRPLVENALRLLKQEAKTGYWIDSAGYDKCSICGAEYSDLYPDYSNTHFCPNCGAKMKGDEVE